MNGYLLDTNICIFALRDKYGVNERLEEIGRQQCYIADVTVMELRFGAYKSERKEENLRIVNNFVSQVNVVPFSASIDTFCQEKLRLQSLGTPIEDYDLFIGCAAKVSALTLVTDNVQHLSRIEGLKVENWVQR
ncbi:MAG: type II toxin-antitoxin system VapC family toxin [Prevotella sp.]|nr:type II toxin-antitoxin system VapC family toxin [Prevotella sp.]